MTTKGIFYVVYIYTKNNKASEMDVLGGPYHTAKELRENYDNIMRTISPSSKRSVQVIQFVSV